MGINFCSSFCLGELNSTCPVHSPSSLFLLPRADRDLGFGRWVRWGYDRAMMNIVSFVTRDVRVEDEFDVEGGV